MTKDLLKRRIYIGLVVVPTIAALAGVVQYKSIKPTINLGRAEIIDSAYGEIPLVKFPNGKIAAADIKGAVVGDNITLFLDNERVTNSPSNHRWNYLISILSGLIQGVMLTYLLSLINLKKLRNLLAKNKQVA